MDCITLDAIPENPNTLTNESNETSSSNVDSNDLSVDKDYIQIQIRFTNGTGEIIHSRLQETVGVLKRYYIIQNCTIGIDI